MTSVACDAAPQTANERSLEAQRCNRVMNTTASLLAATVLLGACAGRADEAPATVDTASSAVIATASAVMRDSAGREIGTLSLMNAPTGIRVAGTLRGLPSGEHGFHLHTVGACAPSFEAAGGHWNPAARQHGRDNPSGPHHGDMTNIVVGADGVAPIDVTTVGGSLLGVDALLDPDGAAIVVHAARDDYRTDPTGDAGSRAACGEVRRP